MDLIFAQGLIVGHSFWTLPKSKKKQRQNAFEFHAWVWAKYSLRTFNWVLGPLLREENEELWS